MKRTLFIVILFFLLVLVLAGIALAVGVYNPRVYEGLLNKIVHSKTGYQYSTKDLAIELSPTRINVHGLVLENHEWEENPQLLTVQNAEITLNIKRLFNDNLPYWQAKVSDVVVQWQENDKGLNWSTSTLADQQKSEIEEPLDLRNLLSFSEIDVTQSKLRQQKNDVENVVDINALKLLRTDENSITLNGIGVYQQQEVALEGSLNIAGNNPTKQNLVFAIQAKGLGVDLHTNGTLNPSNLDEAEMSLQASSKDLSEIEKFLETSFPAIAPVDVSLNLFASQGNYELSKLDLALGDNHLTGDILFNPNDSFVRVNLSSKKVDLTPFKLDEAKPETQDHIEQESSSLEVDEEEIDWSWMNELNSEINFDIGEIKINQKKLKDVGAQLKLVDGVIDINSIKAYFELEDEEDSEHTFLTDLVEVSGTLQPLSKKTLGKDLQLALLIKDSGAQLNLEGEVNVNGISDNKLNIKVEASKLDALENYFQTDFSAYLPADISVKGEITEQGLSLNQLLARFGESDLAANIDVDWSDKVIKIEGLAESNLIDLTSLMASSDRDEANAKSKDDKIFSDEVIDWSWLDSFNVNADLSINELIANKNVFNDLKVQVNLSEGKLSVAPLQAFFAGGNVKSILQLNRIGESANLDLQLDALNISLAKLGATGESVLEGGTTDVVLDLTGKGKSLHQIMSTLNGEVVAEVQKGVIKNDTFEMIGTDVLLELLSTLNPFMKEDETTNLECAALKFSAKDGILSSNNQIAVETSKIKIVGGGVINMSSEELEIGFSPSAKKGIGVNVSSLVKFVRLGGTLSNPHPEADPVGLLKSGAAIGAAVSTGGLSLLVEGLFKRAANSGSACNQALKDQQESTDNEALDQPSQSIEKESNTS
ncbi:MAG: AsmA family protein [Pseudomonadota bacterium]